jgi:hypothetical protein
VAGDGSMILINGGIHTNDTDDQQITVAVDVDKTLITGSSNFYQQKDAANATIEYCVRGWITKWRYGNSGIKNMV